MVTNNVFRATRPFGKGSSNMSLFSLQLMALRSYVTDHTAMVANRNKLRSTQFPEWELNRGLGLKAFVFTFSFLLCGGMYTDLSLEVELIIGTKSGNTT